MTRRMPDEKVALARALRAKGHSISEIVAMAGISRGRAHEYTKDIKLPGGPLKRGPKRRISLRAVYQLHEQGLDFRDIAARLGCGLSSVHRILRTAKAA